MVALLAVIKAIGEFAGAVKKILDGVAAVQDFVADPSGEKRNKALDVYAELISLRSDVERLADAVVAAVAGAEFRRELGDVLTAMSTATASWSRWKRNDDDAFRAPAVTFADESAAALTLVLQNNPGTRVGVAPVMMQVLAIRLAILKDADPTFAADAAVAGWVTSMVAELRAAAGELEASVRAANVVADAIVENPVTTEAPEGGPGLMSTKATVRYSNVTGTHARSVTVVELRVREGRRWVLETRSLGEQLADARAELEVLAAAGLVADLGAALVPDLRRTADFAEQALRDSELLRLEPLTGLRFDSVERAVFAQLRRRQALGPALDALFEGWPDDRVPGDEQRRDVSPPATTSAPNVPEARHGEDGGRARTRKPGAVLARALEDGAGR